jgi:hypothetical protein
MKHCKPMILLNKMSIIIPAILLTGLFLTTSPLTASNPLEKSFTASPGQTLDIDLKSGGSITINGWEKKQLSVKANFEEGTDADWNIKIEKDDDTFIVESRCKGYKKSGKSTPDFNVYLPIHFNLIIRTMGGTISIQNVNGKIKGKTMGGSLDLKQLKGYIDLKTMGGPISLKDSDIDGRLKTMGGRVVFENVVGDVNGSSMGGNVIYKNVKPRNTSKGSYGDSMNISTMGGAINVSDAPKGAKVKTMGGNIHIKAAKVFIKAKTMGGNIDVDQIDGWIEATTMGGNINVTMTGNPDKGKRDVTLSTMGGNITLFVPKGLSMGIKLELAYTKRTRTKPRIISNIDINQKESDWIQQKGNFKKYIYGTAKTKDGKHSINIKTINGNITIKEK